MRLSRMATLGASLLVLSACTTGGGTPTPSSASSPAPATASPSAAATASTDATASTAPASPDATASTEPSVAADSIASQLIFGGPPECPERPFCLIGLQDVYGLEFKEFRALDAGGPITVEALAANEIQVGLMFTSSPEIAARGFVELEDDQQLQRADNLTPVVHAATLDANPEIADLLNPVSALITQDQLIELNQRVGIDMEDPEDVAADWLTQNDLLVGDATNPDKGPVTVGKTNFYEQDVLSEIYAQVLEHSGFQINRAEASGNREAVFPALESGEIDILPEYLATALEYVNGGAGQATADATETAELFRTAAAERGLTVLDPAPATDQNTIVVTQATADQYGLSAISDLGNPAP